MADEESSKVKDGSYRPVGYAAGKNSVFRLFRRILKLTQEDCGQVELQEEEEEEEGT